MKMTKKIISVLLAVMLVLGSVAVAASAEMLTEKAGTVLTYTATVKGKTANADGAIEVEPGEKITVEVYTQTNYYIGSVGSELFAWTDAFFGSLTTADWHLHNHINNYTPNQKYPVTGNQLGSNYASGYEGFLYGRAYNPNFKTPTDASTPVLSYSFDLTVEAGLADGTTGKFLMPEQMLGLSTANVRFRQIYAAVASNADLYGTVADASQYPETINVSGAVINFVVKSETEAPVEYADLTALQAAIAKAATADTANCTSASVAEFNAALAAANALNVEGTLATEQDAIDAAAARLEKAITGLTKLGTCNYAALDAAIAAYEAKVADKDLYTNWADYEAAYNAAKAVARDMIADEAGANQKVIDNATAALNAVVLKYKAADYSAVDAAIEAAEAIDADKYTSASYKAVTDAVAAVVEGYDITKQAEVDAMAKAINDAIDALAPLGACDYTALDAAIAAYEAKKADSYKYSNWAGYEAAYNAAKAVARDMIADEDGVNQTIINDAEEALTNYVLEEIVLDYTAWNAAEDKVPADLSVYTPNSVAAFEAAKDAAVAAKDAAVATYDQAALDAAAADLEAAIKLLAAKADKAALAAAIAAAPTDAADYTPDSWAAADLANVLAAANAVNADDNATQAEVDAQVAAIEAAVAKLVKKADKSALTDVIDAAKDLNEDDYTPESWETADLDKVIEEAQAVLDDPNASDEDVKAALDALEEAAEKLVKKADKTALKAAIDTLPEVAEDEATSETWAAYEEELAKANEVYADANATQEAVDKAEANLLAAIAGVKALGNCDYTALDKAIATTPEYGAEYYDTEAWAAYEAALTAAKDVERGMLDDEAGANQAKIDAAAKALTDAYNALVPNFVDRSALEAALALTPAYGAEYYDAAAYAAWQEAVSAGRDTYEGVDGEADTEDFRNEVAAAADAINSAFAKLVPAFIDYSALEEAVANYGQTPEAAESYTDETYQPYAAALERAQNMLKEKDENAPASDTQLQAAIDAAAAELESTFNALELKPVEPPVDPEPALTIVTAVRATEEYYQVGDTVNFEFDCAITNVTKLQIVFADGSTLTYHRAHSAVVSIADNGDGTETWTIAVPIYYDDMDASARGKLGKVWEDEGCAFDFESKTEPSKEDASVKSAEVLLNDVAVTEFTSKDTVVIKIVCGPDTLRIRLVDQTDGGTMTFNRSKATQDENGNWVWLITYKFGNREYAYDICTADSSNRLTDEGTDLKFTVKDQIAATGPSTGNDADIVVSATVAKARLLRDAEQTFTIVTDKDAKGVRVTDQYGNVQTYSKDVATAVDNGDGTLTWTLTVVCTYADTYTCTVEALYAAVWMSNGTTVSYRVVY